VRSRAATKGKIAGILQSRGERRGGVADHKDEQLPVYERLGDVRARSPWQDRPHPWLGATTHPTAEWIAQQLGGLWMGRGSTLFRP
jgi:hypothetical protein